MITQNWARKHARGDQILTLAEQDEQIIHRLDGNIRDAYGNIQTRFSDLETALDKAVDKLNEGEIFNLAELDLARIEYAGLARDMEIFIDAVFEYNTAINTRGAD
ncbi:hypothetical protein I6I10_06885 [Corynebacterium glucuronolyticum]|uniref:Uncharacterized protein n=1 Tax=Corynebacterium glucuronolyticum TaxID=39791 RepID=A0A7T4EHP5_9CORY|nr:hypothetical protein [Corynebacterium glucuronolyticum]QQB45335.1 hypothetical protein I6I10_07255 [Corynebacterium glucuronolyticum]QQB47587.1 hypothetical protein I6I10_06885 [Corynebacterium glucuronolyticum]WKD64051.1 hypothetical protein CGLUCO_09030 [Corynebacterium glucuronolyticum DSM 44120]SMB82288.1 hypothetical protein SAMN05660745_02612 [Corynebacterium glucuronolyticum]